MEFPSQHFHSPYKAQCWAITILQIETHTFCQHQFCTSCVFHFFLFGNYTWASYAHTKNTLFNYSSITWFKLFSNVVCNRGPNLVTQKQLHQIEISETTTLKAKKKQKQKPEQEKKKLTLRDNGQNKQGNSTSKKNTDQRILVTGSAEQKPRRRLQRFLWNQFPLFSPSRCYRLWRRSHHHA